LFWKKAEGQKGQEMHMGPLQAGVITSTPEPAFSARNEERGLGMIAKLKKLFITQEGKGKGKEAQGRATEGSYFGSFSWWLKPAVVSAEPRNGGDEESLVGIEEEKRDGLEVEVRTPARKSTWGSEAPPAYESLIAEGQEREGS
jgi:hypothetical protein